MRSDTVIVLAGSTVGKGLALAVLLATFQASPASGQGARSAEVSPAPAFSARILSRPPTDGWLTNGGSLYNQRYSPLERINRRNVANLKGVWRTRLGGSGLGDKYSGEAQPIVYEGVIYIVTGADDVFAISVDTGRILWRYRAHLDPAIDVICCGWTSRGVALGEGKVFVGQLDGKLVALDQRSGSVVWSTQAERWQDGFSITGAPLYYDGLVITGFAGAEHGIQGRVKAYHAGDGSLAWTFYTIPNPGELGHDTWPRDSDVYKHGGASVWQTPAVDPRLGLLYFSTGNPGPDFNGSVRGGDNLFSTSIVALDAKTGAYRWHFQQVHHDIWDYDAPSPVVLFDVEVGGRLRKGLAEPSKTGWVYILDRENGEPLVGIEERRVPQEPRQLTAPTQPYPLGEPFVPQQIDIQPEGYPPLVNQGRIFTPYWTDGAVVKPSHSGGANWPPSSYDPVNGLLYVCATDRMSFFSGSGIEDETPAELGAEYIGGRFGTVPGYASGILAAVNVRTNTLAWRQRWRERCYSGSLVTAGGLLFAGRSDGRLTALDSSDGTLLWEFQTGAGVNAPASTFERDGEQYVVVYSGGNLFAGSRRGDSVWLFSLGGTLEQTTPADRPAALSENMEREADVANGEVVYERVCSLCHGETGEGGHGGGVPLAAATELAYVTQRVRDGLNEMPAFGGVLSAKDIADVSAYVVDKLPH
jgi:quinohemoprotein ethanol dehydrogenase